MNHNDNPELIIVQKIVGDALGQLLAKRWGEVTIIVKAQDGRLVHVEAGVSQKFHNIHNVDASKFTLDE